MYNKDINWEERRFWAATIICAGICSNFTHQVPSSYEAEKAVNVADSLISILTGISLNSLSAELYQRVSTEQ